MLGMSVHVLLRCLDGHLDGKIKTMVCAWPSWYRFISMPDKLEISGYVPLSVYALLPSLDGLQYGFKICKAMIFAWPRRYMLSKLLRPL